MVRTGTYTYKATSGSSRAGRPGTVGFRVYGRDTKGGVEQHDGGVRDPLRPGSRASGDRPEPLRTTPYPPDRDHRAVVMRPSAEREAGQSTHP